MLSKERLAEIRERVDSMPLLCVDDAVTNTDFRALLRHIEELEGEAKRLREALRQCAVGIMEIREHADCIYPYTDDDGVEEHGDCGNWPTCPAECPLAQLLRLAGIEPREDGSTRATLKEADDE